VATKKPKGFFLFSDSLAERSLSPLLPKDQLVLPVIRSTVIAADKKMVSGDKV